MDESSRPLGAFGREAWFQSGPIRFAFDDQIVGVTGEAIDRALRADRIGEGGEPFVRPAVRGHDDRPRAIPLEQNVIEIPTLRRVDDIKAKSSSSNRPTLMILRSSTS